MNPSVVFFYVLAGFILFTAFLAVTAKKIFRAAIWLLFSLIGIAGFYFWLQMEFIAAVQIIVYVGGIVVLIIFSIFLTQQSGQRMPTASRSRSFFALLAVISGCALTCSLIGQYQFRPDSNQLIDAGVSTIGTQMLSLSAYGYVLPFEVVSMLLLAAMIGCIVIAIKIKPDKQ